MWVYYGYWSDHDVLYSTVQYHTVLYKTTVQYFAKHLLLYPTGESYWRLPCKVERVRRTVRLIFIHPILKMLYLEDYLELIEQLPNEFKSRFSKIREMDLQVQNDTDSLDTKMKEFFQNGRKAKTERKQMDYIEINGVSFMICRLIIAPSRAYLFLDSTCSKLSH